MEAMLIRFILNFESLIFSFPDEYEDVGGDEFEPLSPEPSPGGMMPVEQQRYMSDQEIQVNN